MEFVEIDGSLGEGGGQILRTSISLSCILGRAIRIRNIRLGRKDPGLRPQHLESVVSAAEVSNAELRGARIGSTELEFDPRNIPKRFSGKFTTGTAGSISLVAQTLIPIALLRGMELDVDIGGGTEVPWSPTIDYVEKVAFPVYRRVGGLITLQVKKRGYYPKGGGLVSFRVSGSKSGVRGLVFSEKQSEPEVNVVSITRNLPDHVSRTQASSGERALRAENFNNIKTELDSLGTSLSPGSSVLVYSSSDASSVGFDSLGKRGKSSEEVGLEAARGYISEFRTKPDVDSHLADMIVPLVSCVPEKSHFSTSKLSQHLITNLAISKKLSGCDFRIHEKKEPGNWEVSILGHAEKSN